MIGDHGAAELERALGKEEERAVALSARLQRAESLLDLIGRLRPDSVEDARAVLRQTVDAARAYGGAPSPEGAGLSALEVEAVIRLDRLNESVAQLVELASAAILAGTRRDAPKAGGGELVNLAALGIRAGGEALRRARQPLDQEPEDDQPDAGDTQTSGADDAGG